MMHGTTNIKSVIMFD